MLKLNGMVIDKKTTESKGKEYCNLRIIDISTGGYPVQVSVSRETFDRVKNGDDVVIEVSVYVNRTHDGKPFASYSERK